jgi:hypothetical protein
MTGLEGKVATLRTELAERDTAVLAQTCGAKLVNGHFQLAVWQTAVTIDPADFIARFSETGKALDSLTQALIAHYLHCSDGTPPAKRWIAFTELPNGRFYTRAFQGYTGQELARHFGNEEWLFEETAVALGGQSVPFADAAFRFQVLPHVPVLAVCWLGDEDFPASYKLLFDAHTSHHLPTDGCAILGSMLTRRLLG